MFEREHLSSQIALNWLWVQMAQKKVSWKDEAAVKQKIVIKNNTNILTDKVLPVNLGLKRQSTNTLEALRTLYTASFQYSCKTAGSLNS